VGLNEAVLKQVRTSSSIRGISPTRHAEAAQHGNRDS
jgi:hypothetical protein